MLEGKVSQQPVVLNPSNMSRDEIKQFLKD